MSGIIDIILGRPLVDDVDNAREPVVLYIGVGDPGLAVGRCAAERDVCLSILVSRVAPRPSGVLDHGVVADSQTGDGRARAALEHHGGHEIVALHDVEHEGLVRVAAARNGLGDLQAAGVDRDGERSIFRNALIRSRLRRRNRARHLVGRGLLRSDGAVACRIAPHPCSAAASGGNCVRADNRSVLILDRIGHIHKSVICAVKCGILVHKLLQIGRIAKVDRLVIRRRRDAFYFHVLRRHIERLDHGSLRIDTGLPIIRWHLIAAEEAVAHGNVKLDDQFLSERAIRLSVCGDIVLVEIEAGHIDRPRCRIDRCRHRRIGCDRSPKCAAVIGCSGETNSAGILRHRKVRRHDVFDDRLAAKVNIGAADVLADRGKDLAQRGGIVRRQVVVGLLAGKISGDLPAIIADADEAGIVPLDADLRRIREVARDVVQKAVSGRDVIVLDVSDPPPAKAGPVASDLAVAVVLEAAVAVELLRIRAVENADGIDRRAGVLERLGRLDGAVGDRRVKIALLRRHTVREQDHDLLAFRVGTGVAAVALHERLRTPHAVGDIRRALRLRREAVDLGLERGLAGRAFRRVRFGRGHERPVHQRGSVRAESHDRDPVIGLFRVILIRHRFNERVHGLLHGILAAGRIRAGLIPVKIIRHRAGLVEHEHDVTRCDRGRRCDRAGRVRFEMHGIAAAVCRNFLAQLQTVAAGRAVGCGAQRLRPHGNGRPERPRLREHRRLRHFARGFCRILRHARAHEQAHAQQHDCAEDERENTFFHIVVLLSQGVGIGSICVLEVLASTVPTCFHTSLTSLAAYFSRFAVCTASAVT